MWCFKDFKSLKTKKDIGLAQCKQEHTMKKIFINQACQHTQTVSDERGSSQIPSLFITHIEIRDDYCGHFTDVWHWLRTQEAGKSQDHYGLYRVKPRPSCQQTESHGNGVTCYPWENVTKRMKASAVGSFKCYSEIIQCKHAWGCSLSTDGASKQWLQDFVDMPEPAVHSAEPTQPTQEETGYIRLPYKMNCHTRSGKRHKYLKCKQQKHGNLIWSFNQEKKTSISFSKTKKQQH